MIKPLSCLSMASILLLSACQKNQPSLEQGASSVSTSIRSATATTALQFSSEELKTHTKYLFANDEPESVSYDAQQRSFLTTQPIQLKLDEKELSIKFYSPRPLSNVTIDATVKDTAKPISIIHLDEIPAFADIQIAITDQEWKKITAHLEENGSAKDLKRSDLVLSATSDDPYYTTLKKIKVEWKVNFSPFSRSGDWAEVIQPVHMKEAVALALNLTYMFSSDKFEKAMLNDWKNLFFGNKGKEDTIDNQILLSNIQAKRALTMGRVSGGVYGLGGGNTFGLSQEVLFEHYADDKNKQWIVFHEFGHILGYNHSSGMTYGPWSVLPCKMYGDMSSNKELPIYSKTFLNSRNSIK